MKKLYLLPVVLMGIVCCFLYVRSSSRVPPNLCIVATDDGEFFQFQDPTDVRRLWDLYEKAISKGESLGQDKFDVSLTISRHLTFEFPSESRTVELSFFYFGEDVFVANEKEYLASELVGEIATLSSQKGVAWTRNRKEAEAFIGSKIPFLPGSYLHDVSKIHRKWWHFFKFW